MKFPFSPFAPVLRRWSSCSRTSRFLIGLIGGFVLSLLLLGSGWVSAPVQAQTGPGTLGVPIPYTAMTPLDGRININFVNETGSAIEFEVLGDTEYRSLSGRSQMSLQGLGLPATFTFRRVDNGFLLVALHPNSPQAGTLSMRVRETANFSEDRTTVFVDELGRIYLN